MDTREFKIKIYYREPVYELYHGAKEHPYHWTFRITASDPSQAQQKAIEDFKSMQRLSSVTWTREIVAIELDGHKPGGSPELKAS
mgnify:CR=1 FL=1